MCKYNWLVKFVLDQYLNIGFSLFESYNIIFLIKRQCSQKGQSLNAQSMFGPYNIESAIYRNILSIRHSNFLLLIIKITMSLRRNYNDIITQPPTHISTLDPSLQQYHLLLQFDIKREKEKNSILEERLKNKQAFIQQMKRFNEELTLAYEQCKNELILAQQKIEYLQNVQYREYTQQIADLKHMLLTINQQSKRKSVAVQERVPLTVVGGKVNRNKSQKGLLLKNNQKRDSKISSHFATQRQRSLEDIFEQDVSKEFKKSVNFIQHFLQMAQCYVADLKKQTKLGRKLKQSWKWIKDVVRQRDQCQQRARQFRREVGEFYGVDKDLEFNILLQLIKSRSNPTHN